MADIGSRSVGELNIRKVYKGYQKTFMTVHPGNLSAVTITASVDNNGTAVPLTVVKGSYDVATDTTTVNYTLTAVQSATLGLGKLDWSMIVTENLIPRPYIEGFFEVIEL